MGLVANGADVDDVEILDDGSLLLSFEGGNSATLLPLSHADEDVLLCSHDAARPITACAWSVYFDGSDVGLNSSADEDVDGFSIGRNGTLYVSTLGNFAVAGLSAKVAMCLPASTRGRAADVLRILQRVLRRSANLGNSVPESLIDAIDLK
jgi:hypothetical protein